IVARGRGVTSKFPVGAIGRAGDAGHLVGAQSDVMKRGWLAGRQRIELIVRLSLGPIRLVNDRHDAGERRRSDGGSAEPADLWVGGALAVAIRSADRVKAAVDAVGRE